MASPVTPPFDAETHGVPEPKLDEFRSIAVDFGEHSQVKPFAQLATFDGLDVVKKAWRTTLWRASNTVKAPSHDVMFASDSLMVVQTSLDSRGLPTTPPSTPSATLNRHLLEQTIITYACSAAGEKVSSLPRVPENVQSQVNQSIIRLEVVQHTCQWHMNLLYMCNSMSSAQAEELVELFQQDLEELLQVVVSALPPSPPAERVTEDVLEVNLLPECPKIERCIHDLVEAQVGAQPQMEAICAHDGSLSYAELSDISSKLAQELNRLGAGSEQRVAILMTKSMWYPVAVLAVLKSGAAFVPLDPSHPETRLKQLVHNIEPCALITTSSLSHKAQGLECPCLLEIEQANLTGTQSTPAAPASPNNAAYIIFTSGSTGKPKGVIVEHSALATSAVMRGAVLGLGPESRVLQYAPHTFDVSVDEILATWIHGGCVCVPSESDRFSIASFMEATRVTAALLTPTSARTLSPDDVPTLRTLQTGGEVLTEDVNDKWSNRVTLFNVYGPTEASVACVISNRTGLKGTGHVLGQSIGGKCWIVDPDDVSRRMAPDDIGELVISGPILARGYFRDPVRTEASFVRLLHTGERVYKTGDLASMDADGTISYHGRKDLEIKIRGQRINIAEVEHAILQCHLVHSAVVEYPRSGLCAKRLTAILCFEKSGTESQEPTEGLFSGAQSLREDIQTLLYNHVSSVLPAAMVPSKWLALPYLPQTTSTKVDRKQVRGWLEEMDEDTYTRIFHGTASSTDPVLSSSDGGLVAIWLKVLKLEPQNLRLNQSFIRNGGDSIMAMECRHLAHEAGLVIDIRDLLGGRSLHDIGCMADSTSASELALTVDEDTDEPFLLSPVQQMYFDKISDPSLGLQQRVCVDITQPVQSDTMRLALNHVVKKHRMLAAQFKLNEETWIQQLPPGGHIDPETLYGFYTEAPESLSDFCTEPMSIEDGPLLHAHLRSLTDEKQTLVLCAHHLVVDFVSWRVILHDLHDALVAAQNGTDPNPQTRSTLTFQQWCREEIKYASTLVPDTVLPFPLGPVDLSFWQLENENTPALSNTYAEVAQSEFRLSSAQTAQLLEKFTSPPFIHPTDVMISTFVMAFRRTFTERDTPNIFVESHGREPWQPSLDVSRTVGWFTAAYPMHLPKGTLDEFHAAIRAAAERRRAIPANGHPYWTCRYLSDRGREVFANDDRHQHMEVVFNYAGTVVQRAPGHGLFGDGVRIAEVGHPNCPRFSLFDISASIEQPQQELVIAYSFPKEIAHQDRIHELVQTHQELLASVAEEDVNMDGPPASFLACPADITSLLRVHEVDLKRDVEAIYPASSIQQHMLRRQILEPWFYRVRGTWTVGKASELSSPVDLDRIAQAWREVVRRHSTLRTVYQYSEDDQQFVSIVLRDARPSIVRIDASKTPNVGSLCRDDETLVPPHGMLLREMSDGDVECQLEFSHVIIDATSRSIILQDLADAYEGTLQHRPSPSFWEYISLTQSPASHSVHSAPRKEAMALAGHVVSLPAKLTCPSTSILEACDANEITVSSFFMTAWTMVLSQQLSDKSVAFDYVLSDRFVDIPGVEAAVGPYIRLPTCQTMVTPGIPAVELARKVHAQRTCSQQLGLDLPSEPTATQGYVTLVNIRSSGTDSLDMTSGEVRLSLNNFNDPWDYDLVFAVNIRGSQVLGCSIDYADAVVSAGVASSFSETLTKVVETMVQEMR